MTSTLMTYKRVLVTGSGGVLGSALLDKLSRIEGIEVASPGRQECDLLDQASVEHYFDRFQPDLVLHLAGKVFGIQGNLDFGGQSFYENTKMNLNVVEASRKSNVKKIVAAGTAAIYSDLASLPMREEELWLGAPHGSEGPYGHAKRGMLAHLEAYKTQYGLNFAYLILTNLYGPNDRFDETYGHVVPSLISRFSNAVETGLDKVVCWGDGSPTRDFLYSGDAANAFLTAAESGSGAMNVATGKAIPIRQLVEAIAENAGYMGEIAWDTSKPLGQKERSYNITKISALGWRPEFDIKEGTRLTINWFKKNSAKIRV